MISAGPGFVCFDVPKTHSDPVLWRDHQNDPRLTTHQSAVAFAVGVNVTGIHLLIATQRADRDVITGQIKANLPFKICLKVTNSINSKIVLDETGAENLIGRGDLLCNLGHGLERAQSLFIPDREFRALFA